jgi:hypothetical protein
MRATKTYKPYTPYELAQLEKQATLRARIASEQLCALIVSEQLAALGVQNAETVQRYTHIAVTYADALLAELDK